MSGPTPLSMIAKELQRYEWGTSCSMKVRPCSRIFSIHSTSPSSSLKPHVVMETSNSADLLRSKHIWVNSSLWQRFFFSSQGPRMSDHSVALLTMMLRKRLHTVDSASVWRQGVPSSCQREEWQFLFRSTISNMMPRTSSGRRLRPHILVMRTVFSSTIAILASNASQRTPKVVRSTRRSEWYSRAQLLLLA